MVVCLCETACVFECARQWCVCLNMCGCMFECVRLCVCVGRMGDLRKKERG